LKGEVVVKSITITATKAARSLSEVLNQVRYQGRRFNVRRGKEVVAQIVPPRPTQGVPIAELNQIFSKLPRLGKDDAEQFAKDLKEIRRVAKPPSDEWV
jgi:antitoxin (DNA-binding transcriptional repressor) of toxin-antitoxin stability system